MAVNLVSPGISVREVDLTSGGIAPTTVPVGAFVGPFEKGPVNLPVLIQSENDLLKIFGKPYSTDGQSEYWFSASTYLTYGGALRVVRSNCSTSGSLNNANAGTATSFTSVKIKSLEDYNNQSPTGYYYASRNPGSWANGLKVCTIDAFADQTIGIGTFGIQVGYGITVGVNTSVAGLGTVTAESGFLKAIVTGVNANSVDVKIVSRYSNNTGTYTNVEYAENTINSITSNQSITVINPSGVKQPIEKLRTTASIQNGQVTLTGVASTTGISVGDVVSSLDGFSVIKAIVYTIDSPTQITLNFQAPQTGSASALTNAIFIVSYPTGQTHLASSVSDWYNNQTLGIQNSTIYWKNIAPKPKSSQYSSERNSRNDQINIVVIDDTGSITGTASNIVEKYTGLSKAVDGKITPSQSVYYKDYIANNSGYIFPGVAEEGVATGFGMVNNFSAGSVGNWGSTTQGTVFSASGNETYDLVGGTDYSNGTGRYNVSLADISSSYNVFANPVEYQIDFLICGPSGGASEFESQAKAEQLISIADNRKDCIAVISPHKGSVVNVSNSDTQTENIIRFFNLSSSSYAVFDSGYKYTYDRFNNEFIYVACNADVAGVMARTSINQYPWYSPAGTKRGVINNVVKLSYNPSQAQRDLLYSNRINPIVSLTGQGTVLFGDKTAQAYQSAFDRINVRRLFLSVEKSVKSAANDQLFEFNDSTTRANFVNIIDPYLRDVKAKRGVTDYLIVCDETNNTPDIIDSNQFRADIYLKPERSINFITLTFVATRTGVSFQQVVGSV